MVDRRFRFGVVAGSAYTGGRWQDTARRAEELGYATLLMPDGPHLLAPLPTLAVAASVTTTLRVGTFVLASTLRPPKVTAWEVNSLATLTDNRFELGIGTGNAWVNKAAVDDIGLAPTTPAQRLERVRQTVAQLRAVQTEHRTPVLIAAGGPRSRALAGEVADIVTLPHHELAGAEQIKPLIAETEDAAAGRELEYNLNVLVIGDELPSAFVPFVGDDLDALTKADSHYLLRGTPRQMADKIERRREEFGYSYVTINALYLDEFAPVVELLAGR